MRSFTERVEDVETIEFIWELYEPERVTVDRHCPNCNGKVPFYDSGQRRYNANGKDIFEYAIYKCGRGHTWNKLLNIYKAAENGKIFNSVMARKETTANIITVSELRKKGIGSLIVFLQAIEGRWRLDKALAGQIRDLSRTQIETLIRKGAVSIDRVTAKPGTILKSK